MVWAEMLKPPGHLFFLAGWLAGWLGFEVLSPFSQSWCQQRQFPWPGQHGNLLAVMVVAIARAWGPLRMLTGRRRTRPTVHQAHRQRGRI